MKKIIMLFVLLTSICANAGIIVRDIPDTAVTFGTSVDFDFNNDGTIEFSFMQMSAVGSSFDSSAVNFITFGTLQTGGWDVIRPLTYGTSIGSGDTFGAVIDAYINPGWASSSQMFPAGDSYAGTRFKIGTNTYYGWILVNLTGDTVTVKSYAYNDVSGASINAGDTGALSVAETGNGNTIAFFPNPVNDRVTILAQPAVARVSAYDVNGRIFVLAANENVIDTDALQPGYYVLNVIFDDGTASLLRVIKE